MNIKISNLYLKVVLLISIVYSNSIYGNNNFVRVSDKSSLSPKSISYQTLVDTEKKEVFIKNLIHGSSSKFFTLTDTFTGLLACLQLLPMLDRDSMLLNKEFVAYLSAEYEIFSRFFTTFKQIQDNYIFSKDKNVQQAWVEFKKLSDEVVSSCENLKVKITGLLKKQKNITNNLKIRETLELALKGNATMLKVFNTTIECVEKPDSLVDLFKVKDLIDAVSSNFNRFNVNPGLSIEVDASVVLLKDSILGNQVLLINVLENFFNNAMQHKKEKMNVKIFQDSSSNEVVFQFNNDADLIEDYALEKINNRERLFYLNYSTKGMGVGTTLSWYVAKMFGHSVKVYNTDKGVSFEYRVPVLDSVSVSIVKKIFKGNIRLEELEKIKDIYQIMQNTRNYFITMEELGINIDNMCMPHSIILAQMLRVRGIPADVYVMGHHETLVSLANIDTTLHFWVETENYVLDAFPEGLGKLKQDVAMFMVGELPVLRREDKESSLYRSGVNATRTKYQRHLKDVSNSVLRGPFKKAA